MVSTESIQKIIPTIYFYVLSTAGMVLIIIGIFNATHFVVGTTVYERYPLRYGTTFERCEMRAQPVDPAMQKGEPFSKEACLKSLEEERMQKKAEDIENALSFTFIGLFVFLTHFYFARKRA